VTARDQESDGSIHSNHHHDFIVSMKYHLQNWVFIEQHSFMITTLIDQHTQTIRNSSSPLKIVFKTAGFRIGRPRAVHPHGQEQKLVRFHR
jgi:hypothetical protein